MDSREFLYAVLIATTWFLTLGFLVGVVYMVEGSASGVAVCKSVYENCTAEIAEKCTYNMETPEINNSAFNFNYTTIGR